MKHQHIPKLTILLLLSLPDAVKGFTSPILVNHLDGRPSWTGIRPGRVGATSSVSSSSALNVWWFGGTTLEQTTLQKTDDESCELVPVRIERPSSNSRKIFGEIVVPVPLDDVWAILTDYDRLAVHVPNLVESRIVGSSSSSSSFSNGQPGDGNFRCRLFQKGAQKIVGFEFGASVTMDMREIAYDDDGGDGDNNGQVVNAFQPPSARYLLNAASTVANGGSSIAYSSGRKKERRILFKCVDSFFFNEFDGEWKVVEQRGEDGSPECILSYVVDVRPKGPVPVAALEWRIREDVPTNLRAVKKAAMEVGRKGVLAARNPSRYNPLASPSSSSSNKKNAVAAATNRRRMQRVRVQWEESETMAAYLDDAQ